MKPKPQKRYRAIATYHDKGELITETLEVEAGDLSFNEFVNIAWEEFHCYSCEEIKCEAITIHKTFDLVSGHEQFKWHPVRLIRTDVEDME